MEHSITGEKSWFMDSFKLSATDTQESRRNFPGYGKETYFTIEDLQQGDHQDHHAGGMTETDEETSGKDDGPYTHIQKKGSGQKSHVGNKQSGKGKRYNSEKSTGFGKLKF
jgi:hypothetical protein